MALSPQLLQFKSSGVYRLEFDKSQTANIPAGTIRLIVGHSNKGPYNTPVLISTTEQFIEVFGSIDKNLEKKGMFFHRSALAALTRGPILALNLASFDANDTASHLALVTNGSNSVASTVEDNTTPYTDFYNTEKFWFPSDEALNDVVGTGGVGAVDASLLRFVNIKQDDITIIVRKAQDTAGFDILARDWYGEGEVPSYINSFDYISDFMVDVFVFKGQFNATTMATDPVYGEYFTANGLDKTRLAEFANLRQVSLIAQYTGSMIPGFVDKEGNNVYIETQINAESRRTGLFCAIDEDAVLADIVNGTNNVDLVGHDYSTGVANELLSYTAAADTRDYAIDSGFTYNKTSGAFVTYTAATNDALTLDLVAGDYILAQDANRLVKVIRIAKSIVGLNDVYKVYTSGEADDTGDLKGYQSYETNATHYKTFVLEGAVVGTQNIIDCLNMVTLGTGLANALVDKDNITYRYIVDTFASYENNVILNKVQLSALAKARQNASAILNAPFISEFKKSTDPSFTDSNGDFRMEYVATGGNLDKNPTALYALPGINDGANYAFYYTGLIARENNKDFTVPSAAYVSNNFVDKFTDSVPWSIVAGPRRGIISGPNVIAAEYAFDKTDRDILEPFGINPIVFQRGAGLTILGNKTAQQSVQSALSSAHVREVLIYIQDGMAAILQNYVFEFNTAQTRLEIKTLADSFMESVKADFGVFEYRNVMDTTNNTNEVIDANIGILDTFVEPIKGLEVVVHRTTVLNTGEIATGNFN